VRALGRFCVTAAQRCKRGGKYERGSNTLRELGCDQRFVRARNRAGKRSGNERQQSELDDPHPPVSVGYHSCRQEQRRENEHGCIRNPLQPQH
jgi:hypothetical protein